MPRFVSEPLLSTNIDTFNTRCHTTPLAYIQPVPNESPPFTRTRLVTVRLVISLLLVPRVVGMGCSPSQRFPRAFLNASLYWIEPLAHAFTLKPTSALRISFSKFDKTITVNSVLWIEGLSEYSFFFFSKMVNHWIKLGSWVHSMAILSGWRPNDSFSNLHQNPDCFGQLFPDILFRAGSFY